MVNRSLFIPDLILQLLVFLYFLNTSYFPYDGKMILDLARVTAYLQTDGTFNVKIKLVINITPQITQH